jgi:hypothetical protein
VWHDAGQVVTALHLVAGCESLVVRYAGTGVSRRASLVRRLGHADLAMLEVEDPADLPPLPVEAGPVALNTDVVALGFPLDSPSPIQMNLKTAYGATALESLLPDPVRRRVQAAGSPSLDLEILRLAGHLQPGSSGAPIFGHDGKVVAVADGGLENGAAGISWGLPAAQLEALSNSNEGAQTGAVHVAELFAVDIESSGGSAIDCGGRRFQKLRTRSFEQLADSTDDPLGLLQLTFLVGMANVDATAFSFDIYVDLDSGATVAVPEGLHLEPDSQGCRAASPSGHMEYLIHGRTFPGTMETAVLLAEEFENGIIERSGLYWEYDPNWSHAQPLQRFDGLTVRRLAYLGAPAGTFQVTAYGFETLMFRGTAFVAVAALNYDYAVLNNPAAIACHTYGVGENCEAVEAFVNDWVAMYLAVALSTFPIG